MFDLPLHPVVVHFPIVLGVLLPFAAILVWWGIKKNIVPQKVWAVVIALVLVYGASALVAVEMGEKDEDKVEEVIAEKLIEEHEETGEMIPWVAGGLLLISFSGYRTGRFRSGGIRAEPRMNANEREWCYRRVRGVRTRNAPRRYCHRPGSHPGARTTCNK